jgi:hypothetical protein
MNGQNYYIPSLSFADFKANHELLSTGTVEGADQVTSYFEKLVPVIGMAIRRNYPDVTDWQLAELLDMTTVVLCLKAIQNASGMTPVSEGE